MPSRGTIERWYFLPQTAIIGEGGRTMPIISLEPGDYILTGNGVFDPVGTTLQSSKYSGDVIELSITGIPVLAVTPDHKLLVLPWDDSRPGYKGAERKFMDVAYTNAAAVKENDMLLVPRILGEERPPKFKLDKLKRSDGKKLVLSITKMFCRVLGLYLAEGSIRADGRTVQFVFGFTENDLVELVCRWARSKGLTATVRSGAGTLIVYVYSKVLAVWLQQNFGNGSFNKLLPEWVLLMPTGLQLELLHYHYIGDGSKPDVTHPGLVFNTRSNVLAQQEQLVLIRCGFVANLRSVMDHGLPMYKVDISGRFGRILAKRWNVLMPPVQRRAYNYTRINDAYAYFPVRKVITTQYTGTVYSFKTGGPRNCCLPCIAGAGFD